VADILTQYINQLKRETFTEQLLINQSINRQSVKINLISPICCKQLQMTKQLINCAPTSTLKKC